MSTVAMNEALGRMTLCLGKMQEQLERMVTMQSENAMNVSKLSTAVLCLSTEVADVKTRLAVLEATEKEISALDRRTTFSLIQDKNRLDGNPVLSPTVNPASLTSDLMAFHPQSKVLVVEDDLAYQWLISKNLEANGIDCVLAPNAQEALSRVRSGSFDLILMDIRLSGGVSGLDIAQRIRTFDVATPIVGMTSATAPRQIASYLAGGMNDVLPKPFSRDGLLSLVSRFCDLQLSHGVVQPIEEIFTDDILGTTTPLTSVGTGKSLYVFGAPI